MYRLEPSPTDSESQSSPRGVFAGFAAVILLSLLGAAAVMVIGSYLPATASKSFWFLSRSSGVIAYVLVTLGVLWGLVQSGTLFRKKVAPVLALGLHSYLNWLGLGFALLHGVVLIGDTYIKLDLPKIFTPFISPYRPIPVGMGIVGFYLMLLLTLSFYARSYLGQKNFRLLHYVSFGAFALVTAHGILSGTDTTPLWWMYAVSLALVVVFTVLRIASTQREKRTKRQVVRTAPAPQAVSRGETLGRSDLRLAEATQTAPWYAEASAYPPGDQRRVIRPSGDTLPPRR